MASPRDDSMEALNEGLSDLKVSEEKLSGADKDSDLDLEKGKEGKTDGLRPPRFPQRTGQPDCTYYLKYGSCRFGMKCKFNHPPKRKHNNSNNKAKMNKASDSGQDDSKAKEVLSEYIELKEHKDNADENCKDVTSHELQGLLDTVMRGPLKKKNESNVSALFIGWWDSSNAISDESTVPVSDTATKAKDKESTSEGAVQECKFFNKPGGCKFGKSCKYIHMEGKADIPLVELNFLGLPLRPGEKECPYYMRNSSCKYAINCKFHHPDPSAVPPKEENPNPNYNYNYNNRSNDNNIDEPEPPREMAQGIEVQVPPVPVQSWSEQRTLKEPAPYIIAPPSYMPGLIPHHGYQVPVNPYFMPVQNYPPPSAMHHHHQQGSFEEYPERPGQPECQHFLKMGFCKYKLACKYHHPRLLIAPPGILSPVGLPLKPDQPVCVYYGRYGVCKYGPACKFDHPLNYGPLAPQTR